MNGLLGISQASQESEMVDEGFKSVISSEIGTNLLQSVLVWMNSLNKVRTDLEFQLLHISLSLMKICSAISEEWEKYLMTGMGRIVSMKSSS